MVDFNLVNKAELELEKLKGVAGSLYALSIAKETHEITYETETLSASGATIQEAIETLERLITEIVTSGGADTK